MILIGSLVFGGIISYYLFNKNTVAFNLLHLYTNFENMITRKEVECKPLFFKIDLLSKGIYQSDVNDLDLNNLLCIEKSKIYFYNEPSSSYLKCDFPYVDVTIKLDDKMYVENFEITQFFNKIHVHTNHPLNFGENLLWFLIYKEFIKLKTNRIINDAEFENVDIMYNIIDELGDEYQLNNFELIVNDDTIKIKQ